MAALIAKRKNVYAQITKINDAMSKFNKSEFVAASVKYFRISHLVNGFFFIENQIIDYNASLKDLQDVISYEKEGESFNDVVDYIEVLYAKLSDKQNSRTDAHKSECAPSSFPAIRMAHLSGNVSGWNYFISLFKSLVHDIDFRISEFKVRSSR